VTLTFDL